MALSDKAVTNAKAGAKNYRLFDGDGLYLEVSTSAAKYWRLKYRFDGKEKCLALGVYSHVSLKMARDRCREARRLLATGIDPSEHKKIARAARVDTAANTFEAVALEWLLQKKPIWASSHWVKIEAMLKRDLFPWLGSRPIAAITAAELLAVLRRIEARGGHRYDPASADRCRPSVSVRCRHGSGTTRYHTGLTRCRSATGQDALGCNH